MLRLPAKRKEGAAWARGATSCRLQSQRICWTRFVPTRRYSLAHSRRDAALLAGASRRSNGVFPAVVQRRKSSVNGRLPQLPILDRTQNDALGGFAYVDAYAPELTTGSGVR